MCAAKLLNFDIVVIGAGAAGMAAACETAASGLTTAVIDRDSHFGGILVQCIHTGFGLHHFKKELSGPEYAEEYIDKLDSLPVDRFMDTTVTGIKKEEKHLSVFASSAIHGALEIHSQAIILAMGCRERNRGNIGISGSRPSGIFTAGLAQRLLNIDGFLPGKRAVIVGSGDIGLIMARRLSWAKCKVLCAVEILPWPSGLTRNIVQCLQDFGIPLYLEHSVTRIIGTDRVEAVEISPLENGLPVKQKTFRLECDTILLSVGLIPENELSRKAGVKINPATGGPVVDFRLQTSVSGIFACGNVLHVHDLVDYVSDEGSQCGKNAVEYLKNGFAGNSQPIQVMPGANMKYVVPNSCIAGNETRFYGRALITADSADLVVKQNNSIVFSKRFKHVRQAEMLSITLDPGHLAGFKEDLPLEFLLSPTAEAAV